MSDIVTLYFSMFRQNTSGSNCGMITTGTPTITGKVINSAAPVIGVLNLCLRNREAHRPTEDMIEWQDPK